MRTINRSALSNCNIPLLPHQKYVAVTLLTGETVYFVSEIKGRCQELFDQICNYLVLNDSELFSLAIRHEGEYVFVETGVKIYKYAPKTWKSRDSGLDASGKPLITFYFRVHLYVDCHLLINDKIARNHYYLQLKENVCNYCQSISEERSFLLAAFALQADLGNFHSDKHSGRYFEPAKYFNHFIINKLGEEFISRHTPTLHRDNAGLIKAEAQINFMKEAANETAQHNLHFYKMRRKKGKLEDVWLGISQKTLQIFEDNGKLPKTKLSNFAWGDITKIHFEKKKFEICCAGNPKMRKFSYYLKNEIVSKSLFWLCRLTHQFNMAVQPRIAELKKYELEATVPFRESYIYSDSSELDWLADRGIEKITPLSLTKKNLIEDNDEQRKSVISNASSNTTSGIVSDRDKVQSLYESEDELETSVVSVIKNVKNHFSATEKEADCVKVRSASRDGGFFESKNEETKVKCDKQIKFNCVGSGLPVSQPEYSKASHSKDAGAVINQVSSLQVLKNNAESVEKSTFQPPVYEPKYFMLEEWNAMNGRPLSSKASSVFALPSPCLNENMINSAINCNVQYPVQRTARTVSLNNADSNGFPMGVQTLNRNQSRNVTRIGVSSLTKGKTGRVPLSLYCNGQSGSEPELNHLRTWSSTYSIDSEHSLPPNMIPGKYNANAHRHSLAEGLLHQPHLGPSITWHSNLSIPSSNYSTLNSKKNLPLNSDLYVNESRGNSLAAYQSMEQLKDNNQNSETNVNRDGGVSSKQSQSQLDIHQLWKTSQHMELPLLAALCNDRSLMLPKTVATCSRQRHSVAAKDLRRFSCSYLSTPLDENMFNASNFTGSQTLGASRQSSTNNQNWQSANGDIYQANKLGLPPPPAAFLSHFGCSSNYGRPHSFSAPPEMPPTFLPPPILTSFGKTQPSKSNEGRMRDSKNSIESCQEFPMSLSSHTSCLPNQKGIYKIS